MGPARLEGKIRRAPTSLFLEATQRKTAPTGRFAGLSGEKAVVEAQVAGIGTRKRRRPAVAAVADITQCSIPVVMSGVAVARGLSARHSKTGAHSAEWPAKHPVGAALETSRLPNTKPPLPVRRREKHQDQGPGKRRREITTPRLSGAREAAQWTAEFIIHPAARPETTGRHSGKKRTVHFQSVKITSTSPPAREGEKEKRERNASAINARRQRN